MKCKSKGERENNPLIDEKLNILKYNEKIQVSYIKNTIDRIRFFTESNHENLQSLKLCFAENLNFIRVNQTEEGMVWKYTIKNQPDCPSTILLKSPKFQSNRPIYLKIDINDPTPNSQLLVRDLMKRIPGLNAQLSQIEFSFDFYPMLYSELIKLYHLLCNIIYLKHSRIKAYRNYPENDTYTHYQSKNGNIHKGGSKGLRIYLKPYRTDETPNATPEFVRVELQLNRSLIKGKNIGMDSLPIQADLVGFFDYLEFRRGITEDNFRKLTNTIYKKYFQSRTRFKSNLAGRILQSCVSDKIKDLVLSNYGCFDEEYNQCVAGQIAGWKELKTKYLINQGVGTYFKKIDKQNSQ